MLDANCLFCKIIRRQSHANIVYEDDCIVAFHDVAPQVPVHVILIPKMHISGLNDLTNESAKLVGHIAMTTKTLAAKFNIEVSGYRLVSNCGSDAKQSINHLHFHLLGGAPMICNLA